MGKFELLWKINVDNLIEEIFLDNNRVYIIDDIFNIYSINKLNGKVLWRNELFNFETNRENKLLNLILNDKFLYIILNNCLYNIEIENGEIFWYINFLNDHKLGDPILYKNFLYLPIDLKISQCKLIKEISGLSHTLTDKNYLIICCIDSLKGNLISIYLLKDIDPLRYIYPISFEPLIYKDKLLVKTIDKIYCYSIFDFNKLWEVESSNYCSAKNIFIYNDKIFTGSIDDKFYIYNLDGEKLYQINKSDLNLGDYLHGIDDVEYINTPFIVNNNNIYITSAFGYLINLKIPKNKKEFTEDDINWIFKIDSSENQTLNWAFGDFSKLTIYSNKILIETKNVLYCIDEKTGSLIWKYNFSDTQYFKEFFIFNEEVFLVFKNLIYCLDLETGSLNYKYIIEGERNIKFIGSDEYRMYLKSNYTLYTFSLY